MRGWWLCLLLAGCARTQHTLANLYTAEPASQDTLSSIVFVPGVLGSQIVDSDTGRLYWGQVFGDAARPSKRSADLVKLALPLSTELSEVATRHDELGAGDMLLVVQVRTPFGELQMRGYPGVFEGLVQALMGAEGAGRIRMAAAGSGELPFVAHGYDWRRDLADEAARLHGSILRAADARQARGGPRQVTLVGHSMGALLVRYYLRYGPEPLPDTGPIPEPTWAGAEFVEDVLLVAPPNAGSPLVFESLRVGEKVNPLLPSYPAALTGTFPSLYQMLPRVRHGAVVDPDGHALDLYDAAVWEEHGFGLFSEDSRSYWDALMPEVPDQEETVRRHVAACLQRASRFHEALDQRSQPPGHLRMHLFAGDRQVTPSVMTVDREGGGISWQQSRQGDGRVTRRSALLDERALGEDARLDSPVPWTTVWFGHVEHMGVMRDPGFLDNALYLLLEHPW